jgi:hypothetical protein
MFGPSRGNAPASTKKEESSGKDRGREGTLLAYSERRTILESLNLNGPLLDDARNLR